MKKFSVEIIKRFPGFTLELAFDTQQGLLGLLGASGSGKSVTLKCIAGIETADEGFITLDGRVLFDSSKKINLRPQERNIGYMFQSYALFPHMTVEQNIKAGIAEKHVKNTKEIVNGQLRLFQLDHLKKHYPRQLSGGQQQRVALARILAYAPAAILLDEPFSALDSFLRWQLHEQVISLLQNMDCAAIVVSHDRNEIFSMCSNIAIIRAGKLEQTGSREILFGKPKTRAAAEIVGCKNISPIKKISARRLYANDWGVELDSAEDIPDSIAFVGIQAESIKPASGACNVIKVFPERVIQSPFSATITAKSAINGNRLYWETAEFYAVHGLNGSHGASETNGAILLELPRDKLLLLKA